MKQMKYNDYMKLINNIVENEFYHIQQSEEYEYSLKDPELSKRRTDADNLLHELFEITPEHEDLIDKYEVESAAFWTTLCMYYFKKGVAAGTANLNFIRDITEGFKYF